MSRPKKEFKIKRNGDYLQLYHNGEYQGSIHARELCLIVQERSGNGTTEVSAQDSIIKEA